MCKVLISTGIDNQKNALKFLKTSKTPMSKSDKDGIGYLAINSKGEMFSERWHVNADFMAINAKPKNIFRRLSSIIDGNIGDYSSHGKVNRSDIKSFALHTRFATCGREFENTHPFIIDGIGLIHNGVIRNSKELKNKISTCDSETVLNQYIDLNVRENPKSILDVTNSLEGYWALGIMGNLVSGVPYLDVLKDDQANLFVTSIVELGENNVTFCTSKEILNDIISTLKWKSLRIFKVKSCIMTRFNALSGEILGTFESSNGKKTTSTTSYSSSYSSAYSRNYMSNWVDEDYTPKTTKKESKKYDTKTWSYDDDLSSSAYTVEDYIEELGTPEEKAVYYDLSYTQRLELEELDFSQALEYIEEIKKDFYIKTASK